MCAWSAGSTGVEHERLGRASLITPGHGDRSGPAVVISWTSDPEATQRCKGDPAHAKRKVDVEGWCRSCHYARRRHRRTLGRLAAVRRGFGLTPADLDALRGAQRGADGKLRCRCGRVIGRSKEPAVDHDHDCLLCGGKGCRRCVRGLLCSPCNVFLGYVGDRPEALIALAWHVVALPAQDVLRNLDRMSQRETDSR